MKLHQRTIDKCEGLYETKAEAHFYGMLAGVFFTALLLGIAALLIETFHI